MPIFGRTSDSDNGYPPRRGGSLVIGPIILALAFAAFQYFSAETYTNPETGKSVKVALSPAQEEALGLQSFKEVLSQSQIVNSGPHYEMALRVSKRLINVVDDASRDFNWSVSVIQSDQANAFCLPGGKIAVYTGILPVAQNDSGLAAVLGHEIAHATARHGAQRMFQQNLINTGLMGLQGAVGEMDYDRRRLILGALGAGVQYGLVLPYSRDHEFEADEIGLHYMVRAGFDPQEAVRFWQRMSHTAGSRPAEWASTHPGHESRVRRLRQLIPEVIKAEAK